MLLFRYDALYVDMSKRRWIITAETGLFCVWLRARRQPGPHCAAAVDFISLWMRCCFCCPQHDVYGMIHAALLFWTRTLTYMTRTQLVRLCSRNTSRYNRYEAAQSDASYFFILNASICGFSTDALTLLMPNSVYRCKPVYLPIPTVYRWTE